MAAVGGWWEVGVQGYKIKRSELGWNFNTNISMQICLLGWAI